MNIVISGGGTGGHLFPGVAIAQEFRRRSEKNIVTFVGTKAGIEARVLPGLDFTLETLDIKGFKGKGLMDKATTLLSLPGACSQARRILQRARADMVIGMGGYASFPAVVAGAMMRVPTAIHEQNSVPGLSNRALGKIADRVFLSFAESGTYFSSTKTLLTGLPVREELRQTTKENRERPRTGESFSILVLGGSQGSREINRAVSDALPYLTATKDRLSFVHQAGRDDAPMLTDRYKQHGFTASVLPFIDDMFSAYRRAHLVIARAGAATLAELALCGRGAILIPYPHAAGNHQEKNARVYADARAAVLIPSGRLSGRELAANVMALQSDGASRERMEIQARALARPHAAATVADECCRLAARKQ